MSQLLESIKVLDGQMYNLDYHFARVKKSGQAVFNSDNAYLLFKRYIDNIDLNKKGLWKLRIAYDDHQISHELLAYQIRPIQSLKLFESNNIVYVHKFSDREILDEAFGHRSKADDILIIKDGWVTDSWYCNVAFMKNGFWFTPEHPLLEGTKRAQLIDDLQIIPIPIKGSEIAAYESCCLFNAMIELGELCVEIDQIVE